MSKGEKTCTPAFLKPLPAGEVAAAQGKSQDVSSCGFCQVLSLGFAKGKSKLSVAADGEGWLRMHLVERMMIPKIQHRITTEFKTPPSRNFYTCNYKLVFWILPLYSIYCIQKLVL
jgi:hypothetical protein